MGQMMDLCGVCLHLLSMAKLFDMPDIKVQLTDTKRRTNRIHVHGRNQSLNEIQIAIG